MSLQKGEVVQGEKRVVPTKSSVLIRGEKNDCRSEAGKEVGSHPPGVTARDAGCGQSEGAAGDPGFQIAPTSAEAYQSQHSTKVTSRTAHRPQTAGEQRTTWVGKGQAGRAQHPPA